MLFNLLAPLADEWSPLNVFRYQTFRSGSAILFAFFLTLFIGILESDGRTMRYVNAGHNPQFVVRANGGCVALTSTGLPIALFPDHGYQESTVDIAPGDLLFFYTDGLVEAENEAGDMFGAERLQAILAIDRSSGIEHVLRHVEETVQKFRGGHEALDDATMMALRLEG